MSETSPVCADFPHISYGMEPVEKHLSVAFSPEMAGKLIQYAQNVGLIAAKRMGKQEFVLRSPTRTAPHVFIRHIVCAHMRFGYSPAPFWTDIGAITYRDHTSCMYGCVSLALKIQHVAPLRTLYREIARDVEGVYGQSLYVEQKLLEWAPHRSKKTARRLAL